jgi:hypothetical protein
MKPEIHLPREQAVLFFGDYSSISAAQKAERKKP